jgi:hypothetical protein
MTQYNLIANHSIVLAFQMEKPISSPTNLSEPETGSAEVFGLFIICQLSHDSDNKWNELGLNCAKLRSI